MSETLIETIPLRGSHFDRLPPEVLFMVVEHLGSEYLHLHPEVLSISKRWYMYARKVDWYNAKFSQLTLGRMGVASEEQRRLIQANVKELSIVLKSLGDSEYSPERYGATREDDMLALALRRLASMLHQCSNLENLCFHALSGFDGRGEPSYRVPRRDFLFKEDVLSMLRSLPQNRLTTLDFDTCGSNLQLPKGCQTDHVCRVLAQRMPTLRHLRVRMRKICPELLPTSESLASEHARLETLIVDLDLEEPGGYSSTGLFPDMCQEYHGGRSDNTTLIKSMAATASALAEARPTRLYKLRIEYHQPPDHMPRIAAEFLPTLQFTRLFKTDESRASHPWAFRWEDDNDDRRYLGLPLRPAGGASDENKLESLSTTESTV